MRPNYKDELEKSVQLTKKKIPTTFSESAVTNVFRILENTPKYLTSVTKHFDDNSSRNPLSDGKRSFRETLIHLLNIEFLNYTTIYPAFLLNKPVIHPIHSERDFDRLSLFLDFELNELLDAFCMERRKSLSFLKSLKESDWMKQLVEVNKAREETIYWRARGLAIHDFTHIQILNFQMKNSELSY